MMCLSRFSCNIGDGLIVRNQRLTHVLPIVAIFAVSMDGPQMEFFTNPEIENDYCMSGIFVISCWGKGVPLFCALKQIRVYRRTGIIGHKKISNIF